jgi:tRNA1Val (adenine37-N6)-methyltransferase
MSNPYFQFKQFTVYQDQCAMKVCADACILGASVAKNNARSILDIGAGTGLLSLILAQKLPSSTIHTVEIDANTAQQAQQNITDSPWSNQIHVFHESIQSYSQTCKEKYDLIVSNPPFFLNHKQSKKHQLNLARHTIQLSFQELIESIQQLLSPQGAFHILLPVYESQLLESVANNYGFYPYQKLLVKNQPQSIPHRAILSYQAKQKDLIINELSIRDKNNNYTTDYVELMKDFYLFF